MAGIELTEPDEARGALTKVATAAWMAVFAGVGAQGLVIGARAGAGRPFMTETFGADMAQSVSWSVLVCAAIAVGTLAAKARVYFSGLIGLLAGPIAWAVAKGVQAIAGLPQDQFTPLFWAVCGVKGLEYAALGAGLALIIGRKDARWGTYLSLGALVGLAGAGFIVALNHVNAALAGSALAAPKQAALATNEIAFATLCAGVIYMAQQVTRHIGALKD